MPNPSSAAWMAPGALIAGRYRLLRQIGQGAMGAVWAATDEVTHRKVALKVLVRPEPELRIRLFREARACSALKHRHIIDVFDILETDGGDPFLVMELLQGETLAELLERKRRLEPDMAARVGRDAAKALAAAHAQQIIHRDLKPANIFLHQEPDSDDLVVKVLDFGISKNLAASDGLHTAIGGAVGSPFYMSPEQVTGSGDIDPRADIWALGVVLFEMLTGVRPFQGETPEVYAKILSGDAPSVSRYVRRVDEGLVDLVARCLRRNRDERVPNAVDLAAMLDRYTGGPAGAGVPSGAAPGAWPGASMGAPMQPVVPAPQPSSPRAMSTSDLMDDSEAPTTLLAPEEPSAPPPPAIVRSAPQPPQPQQPRAPYAPTMPFAAWPQPQAAAAPPPSPSPQDWLQGGTIRMTSEDAVNYGLIAPGLQGDPAAPQAPAPPQAPGFAPGPGSPGGYAPGASIVGGGAPYAQPGLYGAPAPSAASSSMTPLVRYPEGGQAGSGAPPLVPGVPAPAQGLSKTLLGLLVGLVLALCVIGVALFMVLSGPAQPTPAQQPESTVSPVAPPPTAAPAPTPEPAPTPTAEATAPPPGTAAPTAPSATAPPPATAPTTTAPTGTAPRPTAPGPMPTAPKRDCSKLKLLERQRCERGG